MRIGQDIDCDRRNADRARELMDHHGVAPIPEHFAVWFAYAKGAPDGLMAAIDCRINEKKPFDAAICRELFLRFVSSSNQFRETQELPQRFGAAITESMRYVSDAIADNRLQMNAIGLVAEQAETGMNPTVLIASLMEELRQAATRTGELERRLTETSIELKSMRETLSKAERHANTDPLTGLPNRRAVGNFLRNAQQLAKASGNSLGLLLVDVDHFKGFNDRFGHSVGDQVLKLLASILRNGLRENDFPGRYGGEEMIAVLPGASLMVCEAVAERIRRSVADCKMKRRSTGELLPKVTVSIGVAEMKIGETTEEFIERCDKALYLAKRTGRNQIATDRMLEETKCVA